MSTKLHRAVLMDVLNIALRNGPGKAIPPQDELARELRCSRTLVREAMVILDYLGIIVVKPKVGTIVNDDAMWMVADSQVFDAVAEAKRVLDVLRRNFKGAAKNADEEASQTV